MIKVSWVAERRENLLCVGSRVGGKAIWVTHVTVLEGRKSKPSVDRFYRTQGIVASYPKVSAITT